MYDLTSMTCVYELLGHTDIVLCLDTVVFSGHILLASGSKDSHGEYFTVGTYFF